MDLTSELTFFGILVLLSAFFSGAEVALVSLTRPQVKRMVEQNRLGARFIKKLKAKPQRMLATILIGNNLVNIGASVIMTSVALEVFDNYAMAIATGVTTLLILVFGEVIPKAVAVHNNQGFAQLVAGPVWYLQVLFMPLVDILDIIFRKFIQVTGIKAKEAAITEEEIMHIIKSAEKEGSIKEMERRLIKNIFKFDDTTVKEIVTPITDVVAIDAHKTVGEGIALMLEQWHSRLPVYENHRDNIVGIVTVSDLMHNPRTKKIGNIMRPAYFVPETKKIASLLRQFQKRREHLAIVVDEHGLVTGIVTLEDVLEEIVGEIADETDEIEHLVKRQGKAWIVDGRASIEEIRRTIRLRLKGDDFDTMSGFILAHTGRIPEQGETVKYGKYKIHIVELEGQRISKVRIER